MYQIQVNVGGFSFVAEFVDYVILQVNKVIKDAFDMLTYGVRSSYALINKVLFAK